MGHGRPISDSGAARSPASPAPAPGRPDAGAGRCRVLLVGDDTAYVAFVRATLAAAGEDEFEVAHAARLSEAIHLLEAQVFEAIVLDLSAPGGDGLSDLVTVHRHAAGTPIVALSAVEDESTALAAIRRGAQDFLVKARREQGPLVRALRYARERREAARHLAVGQGFDGVTGLPDRGRLHEQLTAAVARAERGGHCLAVLSVGIGRLGSVRESLGFEAGDALLALVAQRLSARFRAGDMVARAAEDEFVAVLEPVSAEEAASRASDALAAVTGPMALGHQQVMASASVGIAVYPRDGTDSGGLLANARTAMSRVRQARPNGYGFFEPGMTAAVLQRRALETGLQRALECGEFVVHYQPLVRLDSGDVEGVEALVRWDHPELGLVAPGDFISVAEESGLIVPLGRHVLRSACAQAQEWQAEGVMPPTMAVNLSARQFYSPSLLDEVARALADSGLAPGRLQIELTESMFAEPEVAGDVLNRLRALGVRVAIDDFGRGFSSLGYLTRFRIDTIKIDRCFIDAVGSHPDQQAIVTSVLALARQLGVGVVAEGVENREQLQFLRQHGCRVGQGFLFCRPAGAEAIGQWLRQRSAGSPGQPPAGRGPQGAAPGKPGRFRRMLAWRTGPGGSRGEPGRARRMLGWRRPEGGRPGEPGRRPGMPGWRGTMRRSRAQWRWQLGVVIAGTLLGAWMALPVQVPGPAECPPRAEGLLQCQLQRGWLPALTTLLLTPALALMTATAVTQLPWRVVQWRGRRRRARASRRLSDPLLEAASWGRVPRAPLASRATAERRRTRRRAPAAAEPPGHAPGPRGA